MTPIDVIAFPFHDWRKSEREGFRTRDGHILQHLALDARVRQVLVVDRPVSRLERLRHPRVPIRALGDEISTRRVGTWSASVTRVATKTVVLDVAVPDALRVRPSPRAWWFDVFRDERMARCVEWAVEAIGLHSPASIAWTPTAAPLIQRLAPFPFVFDSLDNWLIHPTLRAEATEARAAYAAMLPLATQVVTAAPASARALGSWAPDAIVVANGVDPERFAGAWPRPRDMPRGKVVGYAGKLADRIDVDLCLEVAAGLADASFVFVGPVMARSVHRIARRANAHLIGDRSPDDLPAYLQHFDVAWIPHRVGEGETGGDPIKLYEYWAAGRQVVTTAIDGSDGWRDRAWVVADAGDAVRTLRGLLSADLPPKPIAVDPARTWPAISACLVDFLVGGKGSRAAHGTPPR